MVNQVRNAEACAGQPGWFYDNPVPPGNPAQAGFRSGLNNG